jgi:Tfp pilus assembly protein PilF
MTPLPTRSVSLALALALAPFATPRPALADDAGAEAAPAKASALEAAAERFAAADFDEAARLAADVAEDDPAYGKARYLLGEVALLVGEPEVAESRFREAVEKGIAGEPVLAGLGRALLEQGRPAEAVEPLEKAVAADAKSARARAYLGLARARSGKTPEGRKDLAAAGKLDPADPEVARASVLERLDAEDFAGADRAAQAFAKAKKDSALGPFLRALVLDRSKKHDEAVVLYEKALKVDPAFLDAHKNLGILCLADNPTYQDRERTEKALAHLARYEELGGRDQTVNDIRKSLEGFLKGAGSARD